MAWNNFQYRASNWLYGFKCKFSSKLYLLNVFRSHFWTVAYDTIYAIQDYEDDLKLNIKSTTIKMKSYSGAFSSICYIFFILIFCSGLLIGEYGLMSIFPIMTVGIWQAYDAFRSKVENISKAKKHFLYQNLTGLIIWISIIYDSKFLEH